MMIDMITKHDQPSVTMSQTQYKQNIQKKGIRGQKNKIQFVGESNLT